mgnify:CR=1 FL=1
MGTTVVSDSSFGWIQIVLKDRSFDAGDQINGLSSRRKESLLG